MIKINLEECEQSSILHHHIEILKSSEAQAYQSLSSSLNITAFVDGRHLTCPMPLLKTKVALRSMAIGESVYVLATDPNSSIDLSAFCQHADLEMVLKTQWQNITKLESEGDLEKLDTIFHVIITKTHGI